MIQCVTPTKSPQLALDWQNAGLSVKFKLQISFYDAQSSDFFTNLAQLLPSCVLLYCHPERHENDEKTDKKYFTD